MPERSMTQDDPLEDFDKQSITLNDVNKSVYVSGTGPGVIVMTEMPGISPHVARFSRWIRAAGFTIYMPSLFGRDGAVVSADEGAQIYQRACINAEFRAFAGDGASPVTKWLRALARHAHSECGGPGVGAIGMCFTGNFALSMMLEKSVLAPVLAQPALPMDKPSELESSAEELATIKSRLAQDNLTVLAYRFEGDKFCMAQRFAAYEASLGDRFIGKVLPDTAANTEDLPPFVNAHVTTPHSVLTSHLINETGQPTIRARDEIINFLAKRLIVLS